MKRLVLLIIFGLCILGIALFVLLKFGIGPLLSGVVVCLLVKILIVFLTCGIGPKHYLCVIKNNIIMDLILMGSFSITGIAWSVAVGWEAYVILMKIPFVRDFSLL